MIVKYGREGRRGVLEHTRGMELVGDTGRTTLACSAI